MFCFVIDPVIDLQIMDYLLSKFQFDILWILSYFGLKNLRTLIDLVTKFEFMEMMQGMRL